MELNQYKKLIVEMTKRLDDSDKLFAKQIYTIIKKHFEKKGKR